MDLQQLPSLGGLAALVALVETGGVSQAAAALNIGQSALTKRLQALDACYSLPLIIRVDGRLRLTEAGEKVHALAVQTIEQHSALQQELRALALGHSRLRLTATHDIGEHLLPHLLVHFRERYPACQVEPHVAYVRQIQHDLTQNLTDLALLEQPLNHPDLLVQRWQDDELWLVCGPGNSLTETDFLPVNQLSSLRYVLRERETSVRDTIENSLHELGVQDIHVALELGPTAAIIHALLDQGDYVSFLPRFAVESCVSTGQLHRVQLQNVTLSRSLWIARHRKDLTHPSVEAFMAIIREAGAPPDL